VARIDQNDAMICHHAFGHLNRWSFNHNQLWHRVEVRDPWHMRTNAIPTVVVGVLIAASSCTSAIDRVPLRQHERLLGGHDSFRDRVCSCVITIVYAHQATETPQRRYGSSCKFHSQRVGGLSIS